MSDRRCSLRSFWAQLAGSVHPADEKVFGLHPDHTFNLDFPPPAFVGDIDRAPIIILISNGGYVPGIVATEFPDDAAVSTYRSYIRGDTATLPPRLASYYATGRIGAWIAAGKAVLVNAIPYRSRKLSREPENQKIAELLPSLAAHRTWLAKEVLPDVVAHRRFVLVHRNRWWKIPVSQAGSCLLFSDPTSAEPNRQAPNESKLDRAESWFLAQA
jgi:hypothetical protein